MICPICNQEITEYFQVPFEVPYANIYVCIQHVKSVGYKQFMKENSKKLIEIYLNDKNKPKKR